VIVVDTSVVVQWVAPEDVERRAEALLGRSDLAAPDVLLVETANVLRKKVRDGDVTRDQAFEGLELVEANVRTLVPSSGLLVRALQFAFEMNHPVYDCIFLACAEATGTALVTRDAGVVRRAASVGHASLVRLFPDDWEGGR
jgi:predicted nucleic acid-binding protein